MGSATAPISENLTSPARSYIPTGAGEAPGGGAGPAPESMSDEDLIAAIAGGSRPALEALYDRYSGAVYSIAVQILRDPGAAEEAVQDTFFNVWRRASSYAPAKGKVTAWLFSIGHHRVIDEVRKRKRREQPLTGREVDILNQPDSGHNDPLKHVALQVVRDEIRKAMSALRPEQREVVVLAYYGGMTHSEIASKLQQPLGTVKTRMRLAMKKLRNVLSAGGRESVEHGL